VIRNKEISEVLMEAEPILLLKNSRIFIRQLMVIILPYYSAFTKLSYRSSTPFIDTNPRRGSALDIIDQEAGQGTHHTIGEEEHEDTPKPPIIEGTIKIPLPFI